MKQDNAGGIEHQQNTETWIIHYWGNELSTSNDRLLTANKIEGIRPLTLTKKASCIGHKTDYWPKITVSSQLKVNDRQKSTNFADNGLPTSEGKDS